jgi:hypothetical protein
MTEPPPEWFYPNVAPESGQGVEQQLSDENSLLRYYIKVSNLKRKYPFIAWGRIESLNDQVNASNIWPNEAWDVAAYRVTDRDTTSSTYGKSVVIAHNVYWGSPEGLGNRGFNLDSAKSIEGFSARNGTWKPSIEAGKWINLPPYSTAVIREY